MTLDIHPATARPSARSDTGRRLRVLVVHNAYQQRGGEDSVVDAEIALLREHGHDVDDWLVHNDALAGRSRAGVAMSTLWSRGSHAGLSERLQVRRPDVVHVHNTFAVLSPSVYWACAAERVPVVQTLHNFRLACPQAMLLRQGEICEDCVGRLPWPALQHGCYRDSRASTAVVAAMLTVHRGLGTWSRHVSRFIALSEFSRDRFVAAGLPAQRIRVKPNFVAAPDAPRETVARDGLLFVGRLSEEKGIQILAQALADHPDLRVRVIGDGPLADVLAALPNVEWLGTLPLPDVLRHMQRARALVMPSLTYENFPRTLAEAYACGLPVIAGRLGALAELVVDGETGLFCRPRDPRDLALAMRWACANPAATQRMGDQAREMHERLYAPARNHALLAEIYDEAINAPR